MSLVRRRHLPLGSAAATFRAENRLVVPCRTWSSVCRSGDHQQILLEKFQLKLPSKIIQKQM